MVGLLDFKRIAIEHGICDKYREKWDSCKYKRDIVKIATDAQGVEFFADSIAFGWGLSKEYILREFSAFINGNYLVIENGYTSEMFIDAPQANIKPRSTISLFAWCNCTLTLRKGFIGKIYVCGGSNITIKGEEGAKCELYVIGNDNTIKITDVDVKRTDITKSQWRKV